MEALNDDILIRILSYLDLKSQQTIIAVHPRFYHLIFFVWCSQYKTVNLSLFEANFSINNLHHFFECIHKTVKVIRLRLMSWEHFEVLTSKDFPQVHDFRFATVPSNLLTDADMPKIIKSFPNLTTFSPQGNFSGVHFTNIPRLERLTLTYCRRFSVGNLINVMKANKLKAIKLCMSDQRFYQSIYLKLPFECVKHLESIKIDLDELLWFQEHLKDIKNLQELTICGPRQKNTLDVLFAKLGCFTERKRQRQFKILETCNSTNTLDTVIGANVRVKALKIVTDNYLLEDMRLFATQFFDNIQQLYFKTCCIQEKRSLNSLMVNIVNVEFVSFEQCLFTFDNYQFAVSQITQNRKKPLHVNLHQNSFEETRLPWVWSTDGESHLFEIVGGNNYEYTYEPIHMTF